MPGILYLVPSPWHPGRKGGRAMEAAGRYRKDGPPPPPQRRLATHAATPSGGDAEEREGRRRGTTVHLGNPTRLAATPQPDCSTRQGNREGGRR